MNGNKPIEQIIENEKMLPHQLKWKAIPLTAKAKNGVKNYCVTKSQCRNIFHSLRKKQELRLNGIQ